jgi:hypothetical protein
MARILANYLNLRVGITDMGGAASAPRGALRNVANKPQQSAADGPPLSVAPKRLTIEQVNKRIARTAAHHCETLSHMRRPDSQWRILGLVANETYKTHDVECRTMHYMHLIANNGDEDDVLAKYISAGGSELLSLGETVHHLRRHSNSPPVSLLDALAQCITPTSMPFNTWILELHLAAGGTVEPYLHDHALINGKLELAELFARNISATTLRPWVKTPAEPSDDEPPPYDSITFRVYGDPLLYPTERH